MTTTIELTEGTSLDVLAPEVARLQRQVARLQAQIKGYREHMAEVLPANPCDGADEYEFGKRKVQVIHGHELVGEAIAREFPFSTHPHFWELKVNTSVARALIPAGRIKEFECCRDHYVKVS